MRDSGVGSRVQVVGCRFVGCMWCKESHVPNNGYLGLWRACEHFIR